MDQSRMHQRGRHTSAQQAQVNRRETGGDEDYDDIWPARMPSSARRYQGLADVRTEAGHLPADVQTLASQGNYHPDYARMRSTVPPRRTATQTDIPAVQPNRRRAGQSNDGPTRYSDELVENRGQQRYHWLVFVGLVIFIMMIGWIVLTMVANWWQVTQDDWHYGRPRTFQTDMAVGHNDSAANPSHFVALNLNRRIQIIEFSGGDPSKARIYLGPTLIGQGQELAVVTLSFKDVNGDGKLDMIVNVQDSHFVFINENGAFRPARSGENVQL